jgi:DNA-directed RNA polymerase specialized sigma24 family protein
MGESLKQERDGQFLQNRVIKKEYFEEMQRLAEKAKHTNGRKEKEKAKIELLNFLNRKLEACCRSFYRANYELLVGKVDIDDLIQEAKIEFFEKFEKWETEYISEHTGEGVTFYYWFFRNVLPNSLKNKYLCYYRRSKRDPREESFSLNEPIKGNDDLDEAVSMVSGNSQTPEESLIDVQKRKMIEQVLLEIEKMDDKKNYHPLESLVVILRYLLEDSTSLRSWQARFKNLQITQLKKSDQKHYDDIMSIVNGEKDEEILLAIYKTSENSKSEMGLNQRQISSFFSNLSHEAISIKEREVLKKIKSKLKLMQK